MGINFISYPHSIEIFAIFFSCTTFFIYICRKSQIVTILILNAFQHLQYYDKIAMRSICQLLKALYFL
jgi:hypothetical protein